MLFLDYENKCIAGNKNEIYENIFNLKFFKCVYNDKLKIWMIGPNTNTYELEMCLKKVNEENKLNKAKLWNDAINNVNTLQNKQLKYVKKGSDDYKLVLEEYKKLNNK